MMTHVQIDDAFFDHPKVLSVGKDAKILAVAAICYCGNQLTDGFIPVGAIAVLAAKTGIAKPKPAVDELLRARLWEATDGGYRAHDYLDYNSSAEKVRANRDATRERMRKLRAQDVRAHNDQTTNAQSSKFDQSAGKVFDSTTTTTTTTTTSPNGDDSGANAPGGVHPKKPLPENGIAQQIVAEFCRVAGIDAPAVYAKAVGQAQRIAKAGVQPSEIGELFEFVSSWSDGPDLGTLLGSIDKWRTSKHMASKDAGKRVSLPPGFELPPGITVQQLDEWVVYRNAKISLPPDREQLVDRYVAALNGRAVA